MGKTIRRILAVAFLVVGLYALSWIGTVGIVKLITMCFGWSFSWAWATGIWLVICILKSIFSNDTTIKTK